jgi:hypothetical protein
MFINLLKMTTPASTSNTRPKVVDDFDALFGSDNHCYQCGNPFRPPFYFETLFGQGTPCTSHVDGGVKEICLECAIIKSSTVGQPPSFTRNPLTERSIKVLGKTFDKLLKQQSKTVKLIFN